MKLYLVYRTDKWSYDDFDSFVVVANSPKEAENIHPYYKPEIPEYVKDDRYDCWTTADNIKSKYIGKASKIYTEVEIICASFNAG